MTDRTVRPSEHRDTARPDPAREGRAPERGTDTPPEPTEDGDDAMGRADAANGEPDTTES